MRTAAAVEDKDGGGTFQHCGGTVSTSQSERVRKRASKKVRN